MRWRDPAHVRDTERDPIAVRAGTVQLFAVLPDATLMAGIPGLQARHTVEDDHPGWNISDEINLLPSAECRYVIELVTGQTVSIGVASTHPVAIAICDDDLYDSPQEKVSWLEPDSSSYNFRFRARRTTAYDFMLNNRGEQATHVLVSITAPPAIHWNQHNRR
jgi:hypothetical protein